MDADQIIADIEAHIANREGPLSQWYVGISEDPRHRLFSDHNVQEKGDAWIYREGESDKVARDVESYFIDQCGTKGGPGGGTRLSRYVYAYRIAAHTVE